jgi:hypothetical protein
LQRATASNENEPTDKQVDLPRMSTIFSPPDFYAELSEDSDKVEADSGEMADGSGKFSEDSEDVSEDDVDGLWEIDDNTYNRQSLHDRVEYCMENVVGEDPTVDKSSTASRT